MAKKGILVALGDEIRERREARKLSQIALSLEAGVHHNSLGRLERGQYNPSVLFLLALTSVLKATLPELFFAAEKRLKESR